MIIKNGETFKMVKKPRFIINKFRDRFFKIMRNWHENRVGRVLSDKEKNDADRNDIDPRYDWCDKRGRWKEQCPNCMCKKVIFIGNERWCINCDAKWMVKRES